MKRFKIALTGKQLSRCIALLIPFFSFDAGAQTYWPASSPERMYPTPLMSPTSFNLDKSATKYLSNYAYAGTGILSGKTVNVDGWSTNTDGGFSLGLTTLGLYTGMGARAIPNARDVQVGLMEFGGVYYVIASYYDVAVSLYGYDLYRCNVSPGSLTIASKLYTYHFPRPEFAVPAYISTTAGSFPYPSPLPLASTMVYNRISMDVNRNIDKVAIVLTDGVDGKMFAAVGEISSDTVIFSSSLPPSPSYPYSSGSTSTPEIPLTPYDISSAAFITTGPGIHDYTDGFIYVRYYTLGPYAGLYHYSQYPIDQFTYVVEWDGNPANPVTHLTATEKPGYSPLIGLKATGFVHYLGPSNDYYEQYWPDIAFNGDDLQFMFYLHDAGQEDLYINDIRTPGTSFFSTLFTYTGAGGYGPLATHVFNGPTDIEMQCVNTADGRPLSADHMGPLHSSYESSTASLPLTASNPEIRAQIDASDLTHGNFALTFPYTYSMGASDYFATVSGFDGAPPTSFKIHSAADFGKHNIYLRYPNTTGWKQSILTNGSLGMPYGGPAYTAIDVENNVAPDVAFSLSNNEAAVAWASENASMASGGSGWSYVITRVDLTTPGFLTLPDYIYVANNPSFFCGVEPLVALSKLTYTQERLYTSFTQHDGIDYSVIHKSGEWGNFNTWRKAGEAAEIAGDLSLSVGPNPFHESLHLQCSEVVSVTLTDITGRVLLTHTAAAAEVNRQLDAKASGLLTGTYLLEAKTVSGKKAIFKLTKD